MATPINLTRRRCVPGIFSARKVLTIISLCFFLPYSFSQTLAPAKTNQIPEAKKLTLGDTSTWYFDGLNPLAPLASDPDVTPPPPQYWMFWLYGDGNFGWTKSAASNTWDPRSYHLYYVPMGQGPTGAPIPASKTFKGKVYASGLYGGGNPPPKRVMGDMSITNTAGELEPTRTTPAVEGSAYLKVQPHITPGVQGDTNVWILSLKNPNKEFSLSGQVYLFYNGLLEEMQVTYSRNGGRDTTYVPAKVGGVNQFMNSSVDAIFNDHAADRVDQTPYQLAAMPTPELAAKYGKAYFWTFRGLNPGEERHLFVQMTNDTTLLQKYNPLKEARQPLMAVLAVDPVFVNNEPAPILSALTPTDQSLIESYNLNGFLEQGRTGEENWFVDAVNQVISSQQIPLSGFPSNNIADVYEAKGRVSDSYDPNYLLLETCSCPPGGDGEQKLICTVNFQNDGLQPTSNVYITIDIPEGIQMNSLFDSLLYLHPEIGSGTAGMVQVIKSTAPGSRTVTWKLLNFAIQPTQIYGPDNAATYGQIVFTLLTEKGTDIASLEPMFACIRFNQENAPEVCTEKVAALLLESGDGTSAQILTCEDCDCPPFNFMDWLKSLPWWAYLLVLALLILIIWLIRRLRS